MDKNNQNIDADAALLAGLQIDLLQKIRKGQITLDHVKWFNGLSKQERDTLSGYTSLDERFTLMKEFTFIAPSGSDSKTRLTDFTKKYKKDFYGFKSYITDANFSKVTDKLVPGKKYIAKLIAHDAIVPSDDCLKVYEYYKALYVGAQGASVVYEVAKDKLPKGKWYVSFDKKSNLWEVSDGNHGVPYLNPDDDGGFDFDLGIFEADWGSRNVLLVVCDCPE